MPFRGSPQTLFTTIRNLLLCEVVAVVVVDVSAPKVFPMVTIANASTLSGSVVRSSRGGQGLPNMFCVGVGVQPWRVAGSQGRKESRVRSVVSGHAILGPGEPAIHIRCPRICRWWIYKRPADEGSRGGIGDGPRRVTGD